MDTDPCQTEYREFTDWRDEPAETNRHQLTRYINGTSTTYTHNLICNNSIILIHYFYISVTLDRNAQETIKATKKR